MKPTVKKKDLSYLNSRDKKKPLHHVFENVRTTERRFCQVLQSFQRQYFILTVK